MSKKEFFQSKTRLPTREKKNLTKAYNEMYRVKWTNISKSDLKTHNSNVDPMNTYQALHPSH